MCSIKRKFSIIYKIWPQDCTFFHVKKWMYCNFKFGSSKGACSCFLSFSSQSCRGRAASRPSATARVPPVAAYREISRATALLCPPTRASRSASSPPISPDTPARPTWASIDHPLQTGPHSISLMNSSQIMSFLLSCSWSPIRYSINILFHVCICFSLPNSISLWLLSLQF